MKIDEDFVKENFEELELFLHKDGRLLCEEERECFGLNLAS